MDYEKWKSDSKRKRTNENENTQGSITERSSFGRVERISDYNRRENPRTLTPPPAPLALSSRKHHIPYDEPDTTTYEVTGLDKSTTFSSIQKI